MCDRVAWLCASEGCWIWAVQVNGGEEVAFDVHGGGALKRVGKQAFINEQLMGGMQFEFDAEERRVHLSVIVKKTAAS
jgi:hypothetical protein